MIMHICPVTRNKVEHPRAEIIRSKEMNIPLLRRHHFVEIHEIHKATSQYSLLLAAFKFPSNSIVVNLISIARQIATRPVFLAQHCQAQPAWLCLTATTFLTYLQVIV